MGYVQIFPNKVVRGDFPFLNAKARFLPGFFLIPISIIAGRAELIRHVDVAGLSWFRWFWRLTCDFWAENGKRKVGASAKAMKSISSRKTQMADLAQCPNSGRTFGECSDDFRQSFLSGDFALPTAVVES
jgi:hypothetical protein